MGSGGRTPPHHHQHHPNALCCLLTDSHTEQMSNQGFRNSDVIPGPVGSAVHRSPPPWKATSTSLCLIIDNSTGWCVRLAFTVITFGYREVSATQLEHTGDPDNGDFGKLKIRSFVLCRNTFYTILLVSNAMDAPG